MVWLWRISVTEFAIIVGSFMRGGFRVVLMADNLLRFLTVLIYIPKLCLLGLQIRVCHWPLIFFKSLEYFLYGDWFLFGKIFIHIKYYHLIVLSNHSWEKDHIIPLFSQIRTPAAIPPARILMELGSLTAYQGRIYSNHDNSAGCCPWVESQISMTPNSHEFRSIVMIF